MKSRDEGVKGLRKVRADRSNLQKMRGGVWIGAKNGFSLIELIGVLAIMGILASMTVPPILRQIRQAQTVNEDANLNEVARAIVEGIKATGTIPNPNTDALNLGGWATISLPYTALGTNQLLYVTGTSVNQQRRMYLSGGLTNYFNINGIIPPFTTPASGWPTNSFPSDLQIVLASSSREDMVLNCSTAANLASNDVVWLKNYVKTPDANGLYIANNANVVPSSWSNRGEFLHVKTVDLRPLFCRVELIDTACPPTAQIQGGVGYVINDMIGLNFAGAGCQFSFTALAPGNFTTTGGVGGLPIAGSIRASTPLMLTKPFAPIVINDPGPPAPYLERISDNPAGLPGNSAQATLSPALPPQFQINQLAAQAFGANNTMVFYVLKGTSLSLLNNAGVTLITLTVQGDSIFKYFNSTWSRVD